jgi:hypothetical protein
MKNQKAEKFLYLHRRNDSTLIPNPQARLKDQFREVMRFKHYSIRTEQSYWDWVRRFTPM